MLRPQGLINYFQRLEEWRSHVEPSHYEHSENSPHQPIKRYDRNRLSNSRKTPPACLGSLNEDVLAEIFNHFGPISSYPPLEEPRDVVSLRSIRMSVIFISATTHSHFIRVNRRFSALSAPWALSTIEVGKRIGKVKPPLEVVKRVRHLIIHRYAFIGYYDDLVPFQKCRLLSLRCVGSDLFPFWDGIYRFVQDGRFHIRHLALNLSYLAVTKGGLADFNAAMESLHHTVVSIHLDFLGSNISCEGSIQAIQQKFHSLRSIKFAHLNSKSAKWILTPSWTCIKSLNAVTFSQCSFPMFLVSLFLEHASRVEILHIHQNESFSVSDNLLLLPKGRRYVLDVPVCLKIDSYSGSLGS
jgi:hypothetical protein